MNAFQLHRDYSRLEIAAKVGGGSLQAYLPTVNGEVVAGCFRRKLDPGAPNIILPGNGPIIRHTAELFAASGVAVPVFLKQAVNRWRYVGDFRVARMSTDPSETHKYASRAGRDDVSSVLRLRPSG